MPVTLLGFRQTYTFDTLDPGWEWKDIPGLYAFVRIDWTIPNGFRTFPAYIGEAVSLRKRLVTSHERWAEANAQYNAYLMVGRPAPWDERERLAQEADLIAFNQPPMNVQGRSAFGTLSALFRS